MGWGGWDRLDKEICKSSLIVIELYQLVLENDLLFNIVLSWGVCFRTNRSKMTTTGHMYLLVC